MCDLIRVKQMELVIRSVECNSSAIDKEIAISLLAELVNNCLQENGIHPSETQQAA
ncbi:hypothetical protein [Shewanella sp. WE21]|uniref:hypothetical protein n=1 Tax=unclassified Shewanella TaxID=196818 RepID=UPI001319CEB3|nr:hypothetical protein [Shewanella sp. WE21]